MASTILVDSISKRYRIGRKLPSLREAIVRRAGSDSHQFNWAIRDVSFKLQPGEALGIIGPNGAGKTTVLKILSRITNATSGQIRVVGRLSALIELGAGFHPDLTGRENIHLNGVILGMSRSEIRDRFEEIVEFAGIGKYIDTPVKRYSTGMYARLGFAIAAHVDPDVLLVDEVLAVGDYAFQQKCHARMDELRAKGTSLIFVSHNLDAVRRVCDQVMVMYRGIRIFEGTASEAIVAYSDAIRQAARETDGTVPAEGGLSQRAMTFDAEIESVTLKDEAGRSVNSLPSGKCAAVVLDIKFHRDVQRPIFSLTIRTADGRIVYDTTTRWMKVETQNFSAGERCRVQFELRLPLLDGEYQLGVDVAASDYRYYYDRLERALGFWVEGSTAANGLVDLEAKVAWKMLNRKGASA